LQQRVAREHYNFEISMEAKRWLAKKGFDPLYGVRPLKRLLQTEIEDKFTDLILDGAISQGDCVEFVLEDGSLKAKVPSRQEVLEPVEVTQ
jgi:ATP-dependent clp protease, ATP-binding subunit clpC